MEIVLGIIACILLCITIVLLILILMKNKSTSSLDDADLKRIKNIYEEVNNSSFDKYNIYYKELKDKLDKISESFNNLKVDVIKEINDDFKSVNKLLGDNDEKSNKLVRELLESLERKYTEKLDKIDDNIKNSLETIRKDNSDKLEKIKEVVDEKLKKTLEDRLNQSFKNVFDQINGLNKTMGDINRLAADVGSLKNVLANVKTKGIVGEVILGNLIKELLTNNQYDENVATKKGSKERVEFAIKLPGTDDEEIYLPIDSKFPTESYQRLLNAIDASDKDEISNQRKALRRSILDFANDISSKYIDEPNTTGFAIMFLPIEGLYAEVINQGLFEEVQRDYKVVITGPSTFSALLNALQMGFKTLTIQKKSAEVFKLLGAVKTEFSKFAEALQKTQQKVNEASNNLEDLVGRRTRAMQRRLVNIEGLPDDTSKEVLEIEE